MSGCCVFVCARTPTGAVLIFIVSAAAKASRQCVQKR
jgi:hypothetical protein